VLQESNYGKVTIVKCSDMCRNLKNMLDSGINCSDLEHDVDGTNLPYEVKFNCTDPVNQSFAVRSAAKDYICGDPGLF